MAKYLDRGPILQDGGGHLMLGLGDNIAHFVKKNVGSWGNGPVNQKKLGVLNRSVLPESSGPSGLMVQPSAQVVQHRFNW